MSNIFQPIALNFFDGKPVQVARELIGKYLVREIDVKIIASMITETEAYAGPEDLASHARFGKTVRTEALYGHPGTIYIFFTYGIHWMLNIVATPRIGIDYAGPVWSQKKWRFVLKKSER